MSKILKKAWILLNVKSGFFVRSVGDSGKKNCQKCNCKEDKWRTSYFVKSTANKKWPRTDTQSRLLVDFWNFVVNTNLTTASVCMCTDTLWLSFLVPDIKVYMDSGYLGIGIAFSVKIYHRYVNWSMLPWNYKGATMLLFIEYLRWQLILYWMSLQCIPYIQRRCAHFLSLNRNQ